VSVMFVCRGSVSEFRCCHWCTRLQSWGVPANVLLGSGHTGKPSPSQRSHCDEAQ